MQVNYTKPFFLFCFVCCFVLLITEWTGLSLVLKGAMSQGCCCFWSIMWLVPNLAKANFDQISKFPFVKFWKRNSILWRWPQHRILTADSKVTLALQNSIKLSGSERVKSQIFFWVRDITKISSKSQQAALPITIFWVIFSGIALKVGPTFSQSVFIFGVILAIFCNRRKETVSILKHSLWNNKARPFYWCEFRY